MFLLPFVRSKSGSWFCFVGRIGNGFIVSSDFAKFRESLQIKSQANKAQRARKICRQKEVKEGTANRPEQNPKHQSQKNRRQLPLSQRCGVVVEVPEKLLTTLGTEALVFPFHTARAIWTDRKCCEVSIEKRIDTVVNHLRRHAESKFLLGGSESQQFVGRPLKGNTELFQCVDRRSRLPSGNGTEIPWAEIAKFRSSFVGEFPAVTDTENGGREFLGEHGGPSPSV